MRKEPGRNIPYVIGVIAMIIYWPFTIGFSLTVMLLVFFKDEKKWLTPMAVLAAIVGFICLILAGKYLGYDIASGGDE